MKRNLILRAFTGAPLGVFICTVIAIIVSLIIGDGHYYATVPELNSLFGNEITAMIIQTAAVLVYGAVWGGASVIWENEKWSLLKRTVLHLIICSSVTYPIAYFTYWMPHNIVGTLIYFLIFFVIYTFIWIIGYVSIKIKIDKINKNLNKIK